MLSFLLSRGSNHVHDLSSFCVSLEDRMFLETSPQFQLMAWDLPFQGWLGSAWEWCRFIQGGHDGEWQPPPSQHHAERLGTWHSKGQVITKDADRESWSFCDTWALGTNRPQTKCLWGTPQAL